MPGRDHREPRARRRRRSGRAARRRRLVLRAGALRRSTPMPTSSSSAARRRPTGTAIVPSSRQLRVPDALARPPSGRRASRSTTRATGGSWRSTSSPTRGRRPTSTAGSATRSGTRPGSSSARSRAADFPLETLAALTGARTQAHPRRPGTRPARPGRPARQRRRRSTARCSRHITALKLNDEEAVQLCGGTDEAALRTLGIPGDRAHARLRGRADHLGRRSATRVDAVPVEGPVDPTGAGDSFLLAYRRTRGRAGRRRTRQARSRAGSSRRSSRADGALGSRRRSAAVLVDLETDDAELVDEDPPAAATASSVSLPLVVAADAGRRRESPRWSTAGRRSCSRTTPA